MAGKTKENTKMKENKKATNKKSKNKTESKVKNQKKENKTESTSKPLIPVELAWLLKAFLMTFITLSLFSYNALDTSFNRISDAPIQNYFGVLGSYFSDIIFQLFGIVSYALPAFFPIYYIKKQFSKDGSILFVFLFQTLLLTASISALISIHPIHNYQGGILGEIIKLSLTSIINPTGATIFLSFILSSVLILMNEIPIKRLSIALLFFIAESSYALFQIVKNHLKEIKESSKAASLERKEQKAREQELKQAIQDEEKLAKEQLKKEDIQEDKAKKEEKKEEKKTTKKVNKKKEKIIEEYDNIRMEQLKVKEEIKLEKERAKLEKFKQKQQERERKEQEMREKRKAMEEDELINQVFDEYSPEEEKRDTQQTSSSNTVPNQDSTEQPKSSQEATAETQQTKEAKAQSKTQAETQEEKTEKSFFKGIFNKKSDSVNTEKVHFEKMDQVNEEENQTAFTSQTEANANTNTNANVNTNTAETITEEVQAHIDEEIPSRPFVMYSKTEIIDEDDIMDNSKADNPKTASSSVNSEVDSKVNSKTNSKTNSEPLKAKTEAEAKEKTKEKTKEEATKTAKEEPIIVPPVTPITASQPLDEEEGIRIQSKYKNFEKAFEEAIVETNEEANEEINESENEENIEIKVAKQSDAEKVNDMQFEKKKEETKYTLPPIEYLRYEAPEAVNIDKDYLVENARLIVECLADFNIHDAKVVEIFQGPTLTTYELEIRRGIQISKVVKYTDEIAAMLKVSGVRMVSIPEKGVIGVEVPNKKREIVWLKEIITSDEYQKAAKKSKLTVVLGKDISGEPIIANLAKMPHLLIAGTTGSGKSVFNNVLITSILYNATPDEVKFILIDPKMLEFSLYNDMPNLLFPVIIDPKKAAHALNWAVDEMERRYKLIADHSERDIISYNNKAKKMKEEGLPANIQSQINELELLKEEILRDASLSSDEKDRETREVTFKIAQIKSKFSDPEVLPYIVIVLDEYADLMMVAGKNVEISISRIAQKARAAGIHLVIATQRPDKDVVTGIIKANLPVRVALSVKGSTNSKIILDSTGAEKLLGHGDLLYLGPGTSTIKRIQSPLVTSDEQKQILDFLREQGRPTYSLDLLNQYDEDDDAIEAVSDDDKDAKYDEAVQIAIEMKKISASYLQRRLKLGYNRAARIVEVMEKEGIVGPPNGSKPRKVMISEYK